MSGDPVLLTPGPLTTAASTKEAMLHDWGSRDGRFIGMNRKVREGLLELAGVAGSHVCVPVQGSGTFAVEAMLGTLVPRDGRVLVLVNGAYGRRMASICRIIGRAFSVYETPEEQPPDPGEVGRLLRGDPSLTHVACVHCETTTGLLNPLAAVAEVVERHGRRLLVDAMSAFGALPVDGISFDAMAASSNKCLEGVPGMGFVLCRREVLAASGGNAHSLALDLHDQWTAMDANGQWRFTPPTHVIAALAHALDLLAEEGGVAARGGRYRRNWRLLVDGMRAMGFETLLPDAAQAPIIVTFRMPSGFPFERFHDSLRAKGYVIYPGKLTGADSFRIGCIGAIGEVEIRGVLEAVRETLMELEAGR
ncbi:MAG: 2-aminoethylphosphonate--pyruvate transaminase [Alphaproteobacteria bacterium]|nr:2-aminoethylphosphonate--pyruvate transaminase [Alphaproteobacteria bacterium]MBF0128675.1 2-aminoethylphosphonate--pyruvate transaminase [Alphaproteobacteria bacterium]